MSGFAQIETTQSVIVARKPAFKSGGTLLKKKAKAVESKAEANPWDNLDEGKPAQMLNED